MPTAEEPNPNMNVPIVEAKVKVMSAVLFVFGFVLLNIIAMGILSIPFVYKVLFLWFFFINIALGLFLLAAIIGVVHQQQKTNLAGLAAAGASMTAVTSLRDLVLTYMENESALSGKVQGVIESQNVAIHHVMKRMGDLEQAMGEECVYSKPRGFFDVTPNEGGSSPAAN